MSTYNIIYQSEFDNLAENRYRVDILKKDYDGTATPFLLTGTPAIHNWQTDDPEVAIKGSSMVINAYNQDGAQSGSFEAKISMTYYPSEPPGRMNLIAFNDSTYTPMVGVPFTISGHPDPDANGTWTPIDVVDLHSTPPDYAVYVTDGIFTVDVDLASATIDSAGSPAFNILSFYSNEDDTFKLQFWQGEGSADTFTADAELSYFPILGSSFIFLTGSTYTPVVGQPFTISGHPDPIANGTWTPVAVTPGAPGVYDVQVADGLFTASTSNDPVTITATSGLQLLFEGYLVQDDCQEPMVDYIHELSLSFNDNLGLLKDVPLSLPLVRVPLLDIVAYCIQQTGLSLDTFIYANIFEQSFVTTDSFLAQTHIDVQTFLKNEGFDNCYSVLESILSRFHLTLFQADGAWRIVRWDEIRYGVVNYFQYNANFDLLGVGDMGGSVMTGFEEVVYPEVGLLRSITRPFKLVQETFNYQQPKYLLRNYDLQDLGNLQTSYVDGSNTVSEYDFADWNVGGFSPQPDYFIRVVRDTATGNEIERYAVVKGVTGDTARAIVSEPFEVDAGDFVEFAFSFYTTNSQAGPGTIQMAVRLFDGTTSLYADDDPGVNWKTGLGWNFIIPSGGNTTNSTSVTINPGRIPFSGLIYVYLPQAASADDPAGPDDETRIRDIRITYTPTINESTKIIGHVHKSEQTPVIKNTEATTTYLDDAPRNSIIGTLFKASFTGLLQDRTTLWYRATEPTETRKLGDILTNERLQWRLIPRTKIAGTLYGILGLSMLSVLQNNATPGLFYVMGSLEIDYKNNSLNCTMWEMYEDGDADGDTDYTFTYLYDTK